MAPTAPTPPMRPNADDPDAGNVERSDGPSDAGDAPTSCHTLVNQASDVDVVAVAENPPEPRGGTIASGTYVVTSAKRYTGLDGAAGPTGKTVRMTFRLALPVAETIFDNVARTATVTAFGTKLIATTTCPGSGVTETAYIATESTLILQSTNGSSTLVYELTRLGS